MANGNDIKLGQPFSEVDLNQAPLDQDLLPEKEGLGKSFAEIKLPEIKPMVTGTPEVLEFTPQQARQRQIARKYGVSTFPSTNVAESAALLQSNLSKWANGIVKGVGTAGTTFLEPFVDIFVGTPTAIATGKFSGFYNNN